MIKSKIFITFIIIECLIFLALYVHGHTGQLTSASELQAKRALVSRLGLTDPAIWTEARYTRHPSQTDFFSAFQDFPGSLDHFPAGSIMAPIQMLSGEIQ